MHTRSSRRTKVGGQEGQGITAPMRDAEHRERFFRAQSSEGDRSTSLMKDETSRFMNGMTRSARDSRSKT